MALKKSISLPNGAAGDYIQVAAYSWDRLTKEASAHLVLFVSKARAQSNPETPICLIAKLRLAGPKFDEYLANAALASTRSVIGQLYRAAKTEPLLPGGGLTRAQLSLADAVDD